MLGQQRQHLEDAVQECALCGNVEDFQHRILHCPEMQHVHTDHLQIHAHLSDHHPCNLHIPVIFQQEDYEFWTWFFRQLPAPELMEDVMASINLRLHWDFVRHFGLMEVVILQTIHCTVGHPSPLCSTPTLMPI